MSKNGTSATKFDAKNCDLFTQLMFEDWSTKTHIQLYRIMYFSYLKNRPVFSQRGLGDMLDVYKTTINKTLRDLVKHGYVEVIEGRFYQITESKGCTILEDDCTNLTSGVPISHQEVYQSDIKKCTSFNVHNKENKYIKDNREKEDFVGREGERQEFEERKEKTNTLTLLAEERNIHQGTNLKVEEETEDKEKKKTLPLKKKRKSPHLTREEKLAEWQAEGKEEVSINVWMTTAELDKLIAEFGMPTVEAALMEATDWSENKDPLKSSPSKRCCDSWYEKTDHFKTVKNLISRKRDFGLQAIKNPNGSYKFGRAL